MNEDQKITFKKDLSEKIKKLILDYEDKKTKEEASRTIKRICYLMADKYTEKAKVQNMDKVIKEMLYNHFRYRRVTVATWMEAFYKVVIRNKGFC